jgi:hypothetical protein
MLAAVAAALLVAIGQAKAATTSGSPQSLYNALLSQPFHVGELPAGFTRATVGTSAPGPAAKSHHVVGEVEVAVSIPNANTSILYLVFPTAADARADIRGSLDNGLHPVRGGVPGYRSLPNKLWTGAVSGRSASGKAITNRAALTAVAKGNVLISTVTISAEKTDTKNVRAGVLLLAAALRHLDVVRGSL